MGVRSDELGTVTRPTFFVSGVLSTDGRGKQRNCVVTTVIEPGPNDQLYIYQTDQSKHHRWKIERSQIVNYSIGDALDPHCLWWEGIAVDSRELHFHQFCNGGCFATLVCEDLARVDPCQSVIRAVGPNLVFALLMDGPQLANRWPARYGTVLAEDPGSSVLTLTSAGLVARSSTFGYAESRCVALWKDSTGQTAQIDLPKGYHAICLSLAGEWKNEYTLDGRSDGARSSHWTLSGVTHVRADSSKGLDEWVDW